MSIKGKIDKLEGIVNRRAKPPYIMVLKRENKNYLFEKGAVDREIPEEELEQIDCPVIYLDEQDLKL